MLEHNLSDLYPRFILRDRNGHAMAEALDAAMKYFTDKVEEGIKLIDDVDSMPEWRLDEMAWELDCFYDWQGTLAEKRDWIRNALPYSYDAGTPKAVREYLEAYLGDVTIQESPSGYQFMTTSVSGLTSGSFSKIAYAIEKAKNVRSVYVGFAIKSTETLVFEDETRAVFDYGLMCGSFNAGAQDEL